MPDRNTAVTAVAPGTDPKRLLAPPGNTARLGKRLCRNVDDVAKPNAVT